MCHSKPNDLLPRPSTEEFFLKFTSSVLSVNPPSIPLFFFLVSLHVAREIEMALDPLGGGSLLVIVRFS